MDMQNFIGQISDSIKNDSFVRITLSVPRQSSAELKKVIVRLISIKNTLMLNFTYRFQNRDITKNNSVDEGLEFIVSMIEGEFNVAILFTVENDIVLEYRSGKFLLKKLQPSFKNIPERSHDRDKKRKISGRNSGYLNLLGLADVKGNILPSGQDKFRQINQYIEILSSMLASHFSGKNLKVADMGSGKGYLTFAMYEYLTGTLKSQVEMTGVEVRKDLVEFCNRVAEKTSFHGLNFVKSDIQNFNFGKADILVALHACDTATDEAIAKGISAGASMIVTAPCCHKQIRKEIEKNNKRTDMDFIIRHGIFLERHAEMITDSVRALILEYFGYKVKVVEFISDAHTHKNIMIVAVKDQISKTQKEQIREQICQIKKQYDIGYHALEKLTGM